MFLFVLHWRRHEFQLLRCLQSSLFGLVLTPECQFSILLQFSLLSLQSIVHGIKVKLRNVLFLPGHDEMEHFLIDLILHVSSEDQKKLFPLLSEFSIH
jgi:hypothetical protein